MFSAFSGRKSDSLDLYPLLNGVNAAVDAFELHFYFDHVFKLLAGDSAALLVAKQLKLSVMVKPFQEVSALNAKCICRCPRRYDDEMDGHSIHN